MRNSSNGDTEFVTRKAIVSGKVQGVFYRASTREQAQKLGLNGYAMNLSDGSVEVVVNGYIDDVEKLMQWLWQGPQMSDVTNVESHEVKHYTEVGFLVL